MIANETDVAAIIVEPIVGTNGVLVPPPEYMPKLKAICEKYGVLFIADEVMTGWGRTGKWFCVDHWGVKPDILVTAKGITSAYVLLGLCATTRAIADYFEDNYFAHGHTYEAHPMTLGPAVATIAEMERLNLVERAASLEPLRPRKAGSLEGEASSSIGDVRGKGVLLGRRAGQEPRDQANLQHRMSDKVSGAPLVVDQVAAKMMNMERPRRYKPGSATSSSPHPSSSPKPN